MSLAELILMHDPRGDVELRGHRRELALVPPHKSLFNAPAGHGLPIGNLSSQFFANVLLDRQVISTDTFTALLLMAVASTMLTIPRVTPLLAQLPQGRLPG
jgi:hypothetical protein